MSRSPPKVLSPKVHTIATGVSFVDALASGILERWGGDPLALAPITLLLPTRRSCRSLSDAFLRACGGRPLMLPRLLPLGDLDAEELEFFGDDPAETAGAATDLPPATPTLRRQLLLARLILAWGQAGGQESSHPPRADQAVGLARDLAQLLDQVETEGLAFERLAELVPADYARHWQTTLKFLTIVSDQWPKLQAAEGCIGPAERRRRLLEAQAEAWRRRPPSDPVIVAGSTGSIPATATLIQVVAGLPQGLVILPGLDREADDDVWRALADDPSHPQYGLSRLLAGLAVERDQVGDWHHSHPASSPEPRAAFLQAAL